MYDIFIDDHRHDVHKRKSNKFSRIHRTKEETEIIVRFSSKMIK